MAATTTQGRRRSSKPLLKLPVKFKSLTVGNEVASLGFSVARERLNMEAAEEHFCGKRLKVRLLVGAGVDPDQGILWADAQHDFEGVADVKKFAVTPKLISAGCQFHIESIDLQELTSFAQREGVLLVLKVLGDAVPEKGSDEDEDGEEDEEDQE